MWQQLQIIYQVVDLLLIISVKLSMQVIISFPPPS